MSRCLNVLLVVVIILSILVTFEEIIKTDNELPIEKEVKVVNISEHNSTIKSIVLWSSRYRVPDWRLNYQRRMFSACPERRCRFVVKKDVVQEKLSQYDAFLFYAPDFRSYKPLPRQRYPHQVYVFVSQEPPQPPHARFIKLYDNFFNFTSKSMKIYIASE